MTASDVIIRGLDAADHESAIDLFLLPRCIWGTLRLPYAVAPLFEQWLQTHFPDRKEKVLNRIRTIRGGKLYDSEFGKRMRGDGIFADQIDQLFDVALRKAGIAERGHELSTDHFRRPGGRQMELL